jgi:Putative adhesin
MRETFETPGPTALEIEVIAGRVEVDAANTGTTDVEITPLRPNEASKYAAENARVEMQSHRDRHVIRIAVPKRGIRLFATEAQLLVRVQAPSGAAIEATLGSADIVTNGEFGDVKLRTASGDVNLDLVDNVDIKSASGDVRLRRVTGDAKVQSASGDVEIGRVEGPAKVQSASGDVSIAEAHSNLKVQTASGDQRIDTVVSGQVSLQSASGDMRVSVARGSTLWVDARSLGGETTSDLAVGGEPPDIEGPHIDLHATAMSGDIHIARADVSV